jgi:hypothetical protein
MWEARATEKLPTASSSASQRNGVKMRMGWKSKGFRKGKQLYINAMIIDFWKEANVLDKKRPARLYAGRASHLAKLNRS